MEKTEMELIKDMYFHLFNIITDALPYIRSEKAIEILKQAQIYDIFLRQTRVAKENGQTDEASYCKANISSSKKGV